MMGGLAAIAAVFGATAGLDREQSAHLHGVRIENSAGVRCGPETASPSGAAHKWPTPQRGSSRAGVLDLCDLWCRAL